MRTTLIRSVSALGCALVTAAALAGCGTTVDGVAICPGCGGGTAPDFPTTETAVPGSDTLEPNASGYVYIETKSGVTRCQLSAESVGCESQFSDPPTVDGEPATGVEVSADGANRWVVGNLGAMPTVAIDYSTYRAVGWTIEASADGTRFTNEDTGHGMFVSTGQVDFF